MLVVVSIVSLLALLVFAWPVEMNNNDHVSSWQEITGPNAKRPPLASPLGNEGKFANLR